MSRLHVVFTAICALAALEVSAGGAWVPQPGTGYISFGVSRKTASSSWDSNGVAFGNTTVRDGHTLPHYHDFRYGYLSMEAGVAPRVSVHALVTYLQGLEGPHHELERNTGFSDAWLGAKVAVLEGRWPVALTATMRTPQLYDRSGPYNRYVFNEAGERIGVSSEWRGVLKRDYTLAAVASHSFARGWATVEAGHTWREGAPADHLGLSTELGWQVNHRFTLKATATRIDSLGNDTPSRPDDRFRSRPGFNFNDASMSRASASVVLHLRGSVDLEAGYAQWLAGNSARRYREPYVSVGYRF